ncbi:MAG: AMP-binding protein, partial [Oscillospiraceae bacterium]|nr:AMP-binding protein [Candidatus Equicaccousia limihippi]
MIAIGGEDCLFVAVVLPGENVSDTVIRDTLLPHKNTKKLVSDRFVKTAEDENGALQSIAFENVENFNFAFDIVDQIAKEQPDKLAMLHISSNMQERRFTFNDMKRASNQTANYFKSLGIKKGDRVMLVLKRHYQFWYCM